VKIVIANEVKQSQGAAITSLPLVMT